jgi:hypothetical protein
MRKDYIYFTGAEVVRILQPTATSWNFARLNSKVDLIYSVCVTVYVPVYVFICNMYIYTDIAELNATANSVLLYVLYASEYSA